MEHRTDNFDEEEEEGNHLPSIETKNIYLPRGRWDQGRCCWDILLMLPASFISASKCGESKLECLKRGESNTIQYNTRLRAVTSSCYDADDHDGLTCT